MTPQWFCSTLHISLDLNYVWHTGLYQESVFIIISIIHILLLLLLLLYFYIVDYLY